MDIKRTMVEGLVDAVTGAAEEGYFTGGQLRGLFIKAMRALVERVGNEVWNFQRKHDLQKLPKKPPANWSIFWHDFLMVAWKVYDAAGARYVYDEGSGESKGAQGFHESLLDGALKAFACLASSSPASAVNFGQDFLRIMAYLNADDDRLRQACQAVDAVDKKGSGPSFLHRLVDDWGRPKNWTSGAGADPLEVETAYRIHELMNIPLPKNAEKRPAPGKVRPQAPIL
ncbi:MAG: hypothetical protein HY053_04310 [Proteobacteria bacterium]|nr:hypothetical protein [Pseudomonadota bacterium]